MRRMWSVVAGLVLVASLAGSGSAQRPPEYTLDWWTINGGGVTRDLHRPYVLGVTIGQVDAARSIGRRYRLNAGFWPGGGWYEQYLPLVVKRSGPH